MDIKLLVEYTKDLHVLYVEDDSQLRESTTTILKNFFPYVKTAINGYDGLEQYLERANSGEPFDLVITDINMPELDGIEMTEKILQDNPFMHIIFITSSDEVKYLRKAISIGVSSFIQKPIVFDELYNALLRTCKGISDNKFVLSYIAQIEELNIKLEKQNSMLSELSNTDALTHVANRRYLDSFYEEKFSWAKRKQGVISIIMIDIDYFKDFNDFYGHAEGDKCLQTVALNMQHHLRRPTDLLARYGGEEFAIVLLDTNNVEEFAETIRKNIEELKLPHEKSNCSEFITISLGVATGIPSEDIEFSSFLLHADKALYEAKKSGRNCIKVASF